MPIPKLDPPLLPDSCPIIPEELRGKKTGAPLFYDPVLIEKIIAFRKSGLSPRLSFEQAGLNPSSFLEWKAKLDKPDCPPTITYLFANIIIDPKDDKYLPKFQKVALYYKSEIVDTILKYKKAGLSDRVAFQGAGIYLTTYDRWRRQVKQDPDCPKKLKDLFRDMGKAESKIMADVVSVIVAEAVEKKNWKAASDLMPRLWKSEYGAQSAKHEPEMMAPTFNLDELSREEQEIFIKLSKKCKVTDQNKEQTDAKVKLIISLPDNGRS